MAIPLELIERLEEYPASVLETSGVDAVVQYGDEILHLVDISSLLVERRRSSRVEELGTGDELLPVLIYRHEGRAVGIVVGQILDIARTELVELQPGSRPCVMGTLILQGRATELLDLPQLIELVGTYPPRREVELELLRDGRRIELSVRLGFRFD